METTSVTEAIEIAVCGIVGVTIGALLALFIYAYVIFPVFNFLEKKGRF